MKNVRRGLGKGLGTGYKNLAPMDSHIHSLSAKGVKTILDPKTPASKNKVYMKQLEKMQKVKFIKDKKTGKSYPRTKYGEEQLIDEYWGGKPQKYCPDCGVALGNYHHSSCDIEESPLDDDSYIEPRTGHKIRGQLLSSDNAGDYSLDAKGQFMNDIGLGQSSIDWFRYRQSMAFYNKKYDGLTQRQKERVDKKILKDMSGLDAKGEKREIRKSLVSNEYYVTSDKERLQQEITFMKKLEDLDEAGVVSFHSNAFGDVNVKDELKNTQKIIREFFDGRKIPIKEVKILWKEGRSKEGEYPKTFKSVSEATKQIKKNSLEAPKTGGYDKHKFTIEWEDGSVYEGRMDVEHPTQQHPDNDMRQHVQEFANYIITKPRNEFPQYSKDDRDYAEDLLKKYSLDAKKDWKSVKRGEKWVKKDGRKSLKIETRQDRDGKNAFIHTAKATPYRLALNPKYSRKEVVVGKGRDRKKVVKKANEYMTLNAKGKKPKVTFKKGKRFIDFGTHTLSFYDPSKYTVQEIANFRKKDKRPVKLLGKPITREGFEKTALGVSIATIIGAIQPELIPLELAGAGVYAFGKTYSSIKKRELKRIPLR